MSKCRPGEKVHRIRFVGIDGVYGVQPKCGHKCKTFVVTILKRRVTCPNCRRAPRRES